MDDQRHQKDTQQELKDSSIPPFTSIKGKKRGWGNRDGLSDYIIPAVNHIKTGIPNTKAFHQIADNLGVTYNTVSAQYMRVLDINTDKFSELIKTGKINDFLKTKFPLRHSIIDKEL